MKKALLLLILILLSPGCLTGTTPMGANKEPGGEVEKSTLPEDWTANAKTGPDVFAAHVPGTETPPAETPPPAPSDISPISPMARTLPGDSDLPSGPDRAFAFANPGPIEPKTDQGQAEDLPCSTHHLKYGGDFSFTVLCFGRSPVPLNGESEFLTFKFRLEKKQTNGPEESYVWVPEEKGYQVRLNFYPTGKEEWEGYYVDTVTDDIPEDGNVEFSGIPSVPGKISMNVLKVKDVTTADCHRGGLQYFADKADYESHRPAMSDYVLVGNLDLYLQMTPVNGESRRLIRRMPSDTTPLDPNVIRALKRTYPFEP